jgi:hypothetical protein
MDKLTLIVSVLALAVALLGPSSEAISFTSGFGIGSVLTALVLIYRAPPRDR